MCKRLTNIFVIVLDFTFLFLLVFAFQQCKTSNTEKVYSTLSLSDTLQPVVISYDQFFDSIHYVFLQTSDISLLSQIKSVFFINNHIVIHDRRLNRVFVFNNHGDFISVIQADRTRKIFPREIQSAAQFDNDRIIILDNLSQEIGIYNLAGKILLQLPARDYPTSLTFLEDNICVFRPCLKSGKNFLVRIIDTFGLYQSSFHFRDKINVITNGGYIPIKYHTFYKQDDSLFLFTADNNIVYTIDEKRVRIKEMLAGPPIDSDKTTFEIANFIETNQYLFIDAIINRLFFNYVYDKSNSNLILLEPVNNPYVHVYGFQNPDPFGYPIWPAFRLNDSLLCQVVTVMSAKKFIETPTDSLHIIDRMQSDTIIHQIMNKGIIDNPILIFLHVKSNEE